jgi:hypothetical protein
VSVEFGDDALVEGGDLLDGSVCEGRHLIVDAMAKYDAELNEKEEENKARNLVVVAVMTQEVNCENMAVMETVRPHRSM